MDGWKAAWMSLAADVEVLRIAFVSLMGRNSSLQRRQAGRRRFVKSVAVAAAVVWWCGGGGSGRGRDGGRERR